MQGRCKGEQSVLARLWHGVLTFCGVRAQIVDSIETLLKSVQQMLTKVEQRLAGATSSKEAVQQKYDKLVEKQRKYFQLVKDYQAECQKNEELAS